MIDRVLCVAAIIAIPVTTFAQSTPRFEAASVKPGPPGIERTSMNGGPLPAGPFNLSANDPGRIAWTNVWLLRMIQVAYDFPPDRISGPDWLNTERYNIVATLPANTTVADFRLMVANLLAERFKLTFHRATREVSGYALEIARNGVKIQPSPREPQQVQAGAGPSNALMVTDQSGFPAPRPGNPYFVKGVAFEAAIPVNGRYRVTGLNESMQGIADYLGRFAGAPAEDRTGLTGKYDFHLEFAPDRPAEAAPNAVPAALDPGPGLFDAVQAQLGLKLASKKVAVETLIVDHAEKIPTGN